MNKITKGALAIAAAAAIALGGAGSLAYWQASSSVQMDGFTTGTLDVAANNDAVWKRGSTVIDPATARLIPGDVLTYTRTFAATLVGDAMAVTATATTPQVGSNTAGVVVSATTLTGPSDVLGAINATTWSVKKSGTITATITLTVPSTTTAGKGETFGLQSVTVLLQQVASLPSQP